MPATSYTDSIGSTRASDFLTFDTSFNKDVYKSQYEDSSNGSGFGRMHNNGQNPKNEDNFLLKGIEFVTAGASNLKRGVFDSSSTNDLPVPSRFQSFVDYGKSVFGLNSGWQSEPSWKTYTNYKVFLVLFATSVLFFILSFMTLPFIVFAPHKFGLLFTIASITFLVAMAFLRGAGTLFEHMLHSKRIIFTAVFCTSVVLTLSFTVIYPLYLLALISSIIQFLSLMSIIVSYIPGLSKEYTEMLSPTGVIL